MQFGEGRNGCCRFSAPFTYLGMFVWARRSTHPTMECESLQSRNPSLDLRCSNSGADSS